MPRVVAARIVFALVCVVLFILHIARGARADAPVRPARRVAPVIATMAALDAAATAGRPVREEAAALPKERVDMQLSSGSKLHLYPPLSEGPAPVVFMLHGMCNDPLATCAYWNRAGREAGWLACPAGNSVCGAAGAPNWTGEGEQKAAHLDRAASALRGTYGAHVAQPGDDILIGFSRGAFVARDVAYARAARYRGLILIGAAMVPDARRLKAAGIRRVVMACGDHDGARPTMVRATALMNAAGLETRFVSTGRIWHQLPPNLEEILREQLAWVRADSG